MSVNSNYLVRVEKKVKQQLTGARSVFLLGAGSSYLNGNGYPLADQLWESIRDSIPENERADIQSKLDEGADGLEHALDLIDKGGVDEGPHRYSVVIAIAVHFSKLSPSLKVHRQFVSHLANRNEKRSIIFSLNYDPLLERAAEDEHVRLYDGFHGFENAYFDPSSLGEDTAIFSRGFRWPRVHWVLGRLHLFKLHGSVGWYDCPKEGIRRTRFDSDIPASATRLMVPPQHRKAADTMLRPYANLWSEFRGRVAQGLELSNRLISIGYGLRDNHVNAVIEAGLARNNFTLIVCCKFLAEDVVARWKDSRNVILVTENICCLQGEVGPGHPDLWAFERIVEEV